MRKIVYTSSKVRQIVKTLKDLGSLEKTDYYIRFTPNTISSLSEAKKYLDATIKASDTLGFQTDYSGRTQTIVIFTDSI